MDYFNYEAGQLFVESVSLSEIAKQYGTPSFVYSRRTLERHYDVFEEAFAKHDHMICYAVKANSNLALLNILARLGSGFDVVSMGELERVIKAGGKAERIVFSGVGKTYAEIERALELDIYCFNVESESELYRIEKIAKKLKKPAKLALRINPDIDAKTHPYISTGLSENKFGITLDKAKTLYQYAHRSEDLILCGIDCHIGSQLLTLEPFIAALDCLLDFAKELESDGIQISHIDLGGGLGVTYHDEMPPSPSEYADAIIERLGDLPYKIIIEPGRAIVANAGILLTKVEYLKKTDSHSFAIVDAAMNDLLRPSLYQATHDIIPVKEDLGENETTYDIVGPICETGDFLRKKCCLSLQENDLLVIRGAGAYGFVMSSNYNSRPRAIELLVDDDKIHVIRQRETLKAIWDEECIID